MNTTLNNCCSTSLKETAVKDTDLETTCNYQPESLVLIETFRQKGIDLEISEAQVPLGLDVRNYIRILLASPRIAYEWQDENGRESSETDVEQMYHTFISLQLAVISDVALQTITNHACLKFAEQVDAEKNINSGYIPRRPRL